MILARRGPQPLIYLPSNFLPCGPAPCTCFHFVQSLSSQPVAGFPFRPAAGNYTPHSKNKNITRFQQ